MKATLDYEPIYIGSILIVLVSGLLNAVMLGCGSVEDKVVQSLHPAGKSQQANERAIEANGNTFPKDEITRNEFAKLIAGRWERREAAFDGQERPDGSREKYPARVYELDFRFAPTKSIHGTLYRRKIEEGTDPNTVSWEKRFDWQVWWDRPKRNRDGSYSTSVDFIPKDVGDPDRNRLMRDAMKINGDDFWACTVSSDRLEVKYEELGLERIEVFQRAAEGK